MHEFLSSTYFFNCSICSKWYIYDNFKYLFCFTQASSARITDTKKAALQLPLFLPCSAAQD